MPGPIHPISLPPAIPEIKPPVPAAGSSSGGGEFQNVLTEAVSRVEEYRRTAETSVSQFLSGDREDLHNVAVETQRAELALEMFLQTRNKVVQAYQEIMRMQV